MVFVDGVGTEEMQQRGFGNILLHFKELTFCAAMFVQADNMLSGAERYPFKHSRFRRDPLMVDLQDYPLSVV